MHWRGQTPGSHVMMMMMTHDVCTHVMMMITHDNLRMAGSLFAAVPPAAAEASLRGSDICIYM